MKQYNIIIRGVWGLTVVALISGLIIAVPTMQVHAGSSSVACSGNNLVISWSALNTPVVVKVNGSNVVTAGAASGSFTVHGPGDWTVSLFQNGDPVNTYKTSCPGLAQAPTDDPLKFPGSGNAALSIAYRLDDGGFDLYEYNPLIQNGFLAFRMTCDEETTIARQAERQYIAGQNPNVPIYTGTDPLGHPVTITFVFPDQIQINGYFGDGKAHNYSFPACVDAHTVELVTRTPSLTPSPTPSLTPTPILPIFTVSASCTVRGDATFVITNTGGNMPSNGTWQLKQNGNLLGTDVFRIGSGAHFTVSSSGLFGTLSITASGAGAASQSTSTICQPPTATPTPLPPAYSVTASCTARGDATFVITNIGGNMLSNGTWQLKQNGNLLGTDVFRIGSGAHFTVSSSGLFGTLTMSASGAGAASQSASTTCIAPTATPH